MNKTLTSRQILKYILLLSLTIILSTCLCTPSSAFEDGSGTVNDPYQISTVEQLQLINDNLSAHYILVRDIDASSTSSWNGNAGFEPIGSNSNKFTGSLDGQGYEITGLYINRSSEFYVGLFGYVDSSCRIENISIINCNVTGNFNVGGLVGLNNANLTQCYATGNVTGSYYVGGLVGDNYDNLTQCYATGNVTGSYYVGGLVGENIIGSTTQCYATSNVTGIESVGGLVGLNNANLTQCYATGNVTGSSSVGGLVGDNSGTITKCYWDKETTGQTSSAGSHPSHGKETGEMKTESTFVDWDFDNVWAFCDEVTAS